MGNECSTARCSRARGEAAKDSPVKPPTALDLVRRLRTSHDTARHHELLLEQCRRNRLGINLLMDSLEVQKDVIVCKEEQIKTVDCFWIVSQKVWRNTHRIILFIHGAGLLSGSGNDVTKACIAPMLSTFGDARVLFIDYRLLPEISVDDTLHDCLDAYLTLIGMGGVGPSNLSIVCETTGALLTLQMLAELRTRGKPLPATVVLISPHVDMSREKDSSSLLAADWPEAETRGQSPLHQRFDGFPPLFIQTGSNEPARLDSERIQQQARAAAAQCYLREWPQASHGSQLFDMTTLERANHEIGDWIQSHTAADYIDGHVSSTKLNHMQSPLIQRTA